MPPPSGIQLAMPIGAEDLGALVQSFVDSSLGNSTFQKELLNWVTEMAIVIIEEEEEETHVFVLCLGPQKLFKQRSSSSRLSLLGTFMRSLHNSKGSQVYDRSDDDSSSAESLGL